MRITSVQGLILLLAVRLLAMIWVPLTDPTEARYAEIARKMVETGNWVTPQFDYGVPFWGKPPLHTWLSAAGMELFGTNQFSARLGIFISALATLSILWAWARRLTDERIANATVLLTASSGLFFLSTGFVQTDMVMTLGVTACMAGFHAGIEGDRRWGWLFFLGLAIGLLAKGPVALVLSTAPVIVWMIWRGNWSELHRLPLLGGITLCVMLVAPWYIAAEVATPGFLRYFIVGEHIQRFLKPGWTGDLYGSGRRYPHGTIWLFWLAATLPWSVLLPVLVRRLIKQGVPLSDDVALYLLLYAAIPMVLFSAAANVLVTYVLPGIPAAALLAVMLWQRTGPPRTAWVALGVAEVLVVFLAIAIASSLGYDRVFLPTEARLVETFPASNRLAVFDSRSFSAEFYRQGQVVSQKSIEELAEWLRSGDGVLVRKRDHDVVAERLSNKLMMVDEDRRYQLFVAK